MSSIAEKLTYKNYKELATEVAQEFFPVGTLVRGCSFIYDFGIVKSISDTGKITVQKGKLKFEKSTDIARNYTYAKHWYSGNIDDFIIPSEQDFMHSGQKPTTRFSPTCYLGNDWNKKGYNAPIRWTMEYGSRLFILFKPKIESNGLIMCEKYCS